MLTGWGWISQDEPLPEELKAAINKHITDELRKQRKKFQTELRRQVTLAVATEVDLDMFMYRYFSKLREDVEEARKYKWAESYWERSEEEVAHVIYHLVQLALEYSLTDISLKPNWIPMKKEERDEEPRTLEQRQ